MLIYIHFRNFLPLRFDHDILLSPNVLVTRTELRGSYERGLPLLGVGISVTSTYLSTFSSFLYAVYIARIFEDNNFQFSKLQLQKLIPQNYSAMYTV